MSCWNKILDLTNYEISNKILLKKKDKTEKQIAQTSSTTYNTKVLTEKSREDIWSSSEEYNAINL